MKKLFFFATVALTVLAVSCQKKEVVADEVKLTSEATATVPMEGDVVTISFSANVAWTAKSSQEWLTVSPAKGEAGEKLTVKASAVKNETTDSRTAEVTITAGTASAKVTVTQGQTDALDVKTKEFTVDYEGGVVEVPVSANVEYQVVIPEAVDWIHVTEPSKAMVDSKVYLKVDETHEYAEEYLVDWSDEHIVRSANVTIKSGALTQTVTVSQKTFTPYFDYTGDWAGLQWSFYEGVATPIPQEGADIVIPVETNIDWYTYFSVWDNEKEAMVDAWELDWAHLTYDTEKGEIHLVIDPNETYYSRTQYLYAACFIDEVLDGNFGGLGLFEQAGLPIEGAIAQKDWVVSFGDNIAAGNNRLAYKTLGGDALLVSDGAKVHVLSPADGTWWKALEWTTVVPKSICSDDAGNVIVADNSSALEGNEYSVYYVDDFAAEPKLLFTETSDFNGDYVGDFRVRGDITDKAFVTGIIMAAPYFGDNYWSGWLVNNLTKGTLYRGPINAVDGDAGALDYAALAPIGNKPEDGILYRAYDGARNVYYLGTAEIPAWQQAYDWKVITEAGNSPNVNQCAITTADYQGKKIMAITQGFHFNYSYDQGFIAVLDITNPLDVKPVITIEANDFLDFDGGCTWNAAADVLMHPTDTGLELYVVNAGLATVAKYTILIGE